MQWIHDLVLPDDTAEDWNERRQKIRSRILSFLGELPTETVDLDPRVLEEKDESAHTFKKVEYASEPGCRIRAFLLIPKNVETPVPAVVCCHGTAKEGKMAVAGPEARCDRAGELVDRGYAVLAPDTITMGEYIAPGYEPLDTSWVYERFPNRTAQGKILFDFKRAVDYLRSLSEVDGEMIGVTGHSLGGRTSHYLGAFDERIKCVAMSCGVTPLSSDNRLLWEKSRYDPLPTVKERVKKNGGRLPFEKHEITSLIAPRALMIVSPANDVYNLRTDQISAMAHRVFEIYRLLDAPDNFSRFLHGYGHGTNRFVRNVMLDWLDIHLKRNQSPLSEKEFGKLTWKGNE